jgi:hypothetical protein
VNEICWRHSEITQRFPESVDEQTKVENFQPKRKLLTKPKFVMENTLNFATFEVKFWEKEIIAR